MKNKKIPPHCLNFTVKRYFYVKILENFAFVCLVMLFCLGFVVDNGIS